MSYDAVARLLNRMDHEPNRGQVVDEIGGQAVRARAAIDHAVKEGWVIETELNANHKTYGPGEHPSIELTSVSVPVRVRPE